MKNQVVFYDDSAQSWKRALMAFRSLLKNALDNIAQPTCVLIEATEEVDWAQWWTWWRRGRP